MSLNIIKDTYDKPTSNISLNGGKLEAFPLRSEKNIRMPTLASFIHSFGISCHSSQTKKKGINGIQIGKEEVKQSLFADDMILNC